MSHLASLVSTDFPTESTAVQQKSYVTFSCLPPASQLSDIPDAEPTITLLERPHLISGSTTTGFRTWEAALHLGSYLLDPANEHIVRSKSVIDLGAGTGFVSILCAKHLGAKHVTATDGDEGVVESLKENLFLNELDDESKVNASVLRWGRGIKGTWVEDECETWPYDVVLGADIVILIKAHWTIEQLVTDTTPDVRQNRYIGVSCNLTYDERHETGCTDPHLRSCAEH